MGRKSALFALLSLAACSGAANHLGNPLLWPVYAVSAGVENAIYDNRRGAVELQVKSNFPGILDEIASGGGPALTEAMELARVPEADRAARILQMQADLPLYAESPDALVVALMVYGT